MPLAWYSLTALEPYYRKQTGDVRRVKKIQTGASNTQVTSDDKKKGGGLKSPAEKVMQRAADAYEAAGETVRTARTVTILAKQIMSRPVKTIPEELSLAEALEIFRQERYRHIPVTSSDNVMTGIVSDRDILWHIHSRAGNGSKTLKDVMTERVLTAAPHTEIRDIARVMFEERIGAMPVLDSDGVLTGIITRSDILRTVMHHPEFDLLI